MQTSSKFHKNKYKLDKPYVESDLQGKIGRWLNDGNWFDHECEVKISTGGTIAFSKFQSQQIPALRDANTTGLYHKISDQSRDKKPFDYICPVGRPAYVACQFWKNRQQEICHYLHIQKVLEIKNNGAKSLSEEDFIEHGFSVNLAKYKYAKKNKVKGVHKLYKTANRSAEKTPGRH